MQHTQQHQSAASRIRTAEKIWSTLNSSAYFTALNPAHHIFTGAVQVTFCIQKPTDVSAVNETVS
jgi:hypothetical protein